MYDYIKGILTDISPSKATLETHGVGYSLFIPVSAFAELIRFQGKEITLFSSFVVREDSHRLFGFLNKEQKEAFETLSEVSGIGPKTALAIIGHLSLKELERAVQEQDLFTLSKVPGIGKKTAERLILDMKDKLKHLHTAFNEKDILSKDQLSLMGDALSALLHLGYSQSLAQPVIKKAIQKISLPHTLSELITISLKLLRTKDS
jgi:Holliday junction DNA helicase RuvA